MARRTAGRPVNPIARETLLTVAAEAFAERGYRGASLALIAERAGLSKASLLHHFASKKALYLETMTSTVRDLHAHVLAAAAPHASFVERLDELGATMVRYFGGHPPVARLLLRELMDGGPFWHGPGGPAVTATLEAVVAFLQQARSGTDAHGPSAWDGDTERQLAFSIIGAHLVYFATAELTSRTIGGDVFDPALVERRVSSLQAHVRRLLAG